MTETLTLSTDPPITVALRRSKRARRLTLRIAPGGRGPILTMPARLALAEAERAVGFAR